MGKTYSSGDWPPQTTGWVLASVSGVETTKRATQSREAVAIARVKEGRMGRRRERGPRLKHRLRGPANRWRFALVSRSPSRGPCARDPQSVSPNASREGRASLRLQAPRKKAGCGLWGRELGSAVSAGGRLASGPGLRSATATPPLLWLPEQSAPRSRAPGYKRRGREGRGGGAYAKRLTLREGGSAATQPQKNREEVEKQEERSW